MEWAIGPFSFSVPPADAWAFYLYMVIVGFVIRYFLVMRPTLSLRSAYTHNFCGNIGLCGGSASRMCIDGKRTLEGTSCILSVGEDFTSICTSWLYIF